VLVGVAALAAAAWSNRAALHARRLVDQIAEEEAGRGERLTELLALEERGLALEAVESRLAGAEGDERWPLLYALLLILPREQVTAERLGEETYRQLLLVARGYALFEEQAAQPKSLRFLGVGPWRSGPPAEAALVELAGDDVFDLTLPARALGAGEAAALETLETASAAAEPFLRVAAAEALGLVREPEGRVLEALAKLAEHDTHPHVSLAAVRAFLGITLPGAAPRKLSGEEQAWLRALLTDDPSKLGRGNVRLAWRVAVARALAAHSPGDPAARAELTGPLALASHTRSGFVGPHDRTIQGVWEAEDLLLGALALSPPPDPRVVRGNLETALALEVPAGALSGFVSQGASVSCPPAAESPDDSIIGPWLWAAQARREPRRALGWLAERPPRVFLFAAGGGLDEDALYRGLATGPRRQAIADAAIELLTRFRAGPDAFGGLDHAHALSFLGAHAVRVAAICGDEGHASSLEAYASVGQGEWAAQGPWVRRVAGLLRGELPAELASGRGRARAFLRQHLGADGRAGAEHVHPASHGCTLQGRGIEHRDHRTALACLALLGEPDATTTLAPTVRWLSDPAQDRLGARRPRPSNPIAPGQAAASAAIGDVPAGLEELFVVLALQGAVERGVEAEAASAALARRARALTAQRVAWDEEPYHLLAVAASSSSQLELRGEAERLRARGRHAQPRSPWAHAATRWLPPPDDALARVVPALPSPTQGDPWLTTAALRAETPTFDRRVWLLGVFEALARDLEAEVPAPPDDRPGVCPGAILRLGQEDPLVLTAWFVLACDAVEAALRLEPRSD
jgi:hypothetical protein